MASSSSLSQTWKHDVFPSFHGKDVRKSFLSHILKEFRRKAINFFFDNEMERGEFIGPVLKEAINGSKIAVVLLSKNYASSSWCLDELVEIMMKKESGQTVIVIFYGVDPTDVKKQKGDFGKVFKKSCKAICSDNEAAMIENIAAYISNKLNYLIPSRDFDHLIGMEAHMSRMNQFLRHDLDEVRMIGIWGPAGIGKTTIARFLFNQISGGFQNSAFMENIKGNYPRPCLDAYNAKLKLQEEMLSRMIDQKGIVIPHLGVAKQRLRHMTVCLVLDDVDRLAQLEALAENVQWFGPRSRIIITTEDRRLLKAHKVEHIYTVSFPSDDEAFEMFCMYAFNKKTPEDGFDALAREITYIVGELPLALEVIGSHFRGLSKEEWPMEVSRLRTTLDKYIESILKFSYDALCDEDKDLFLHIACFFNGMDMYDVEKCLGGKFKYLRERLYGLEMKALISIIRDEIEFPYDYIHMHSLLVQLGKEIVRKQSVSERQFLVSVKDSCEVYTTKTFEEMYNLQYIRVDINHLNITSSTVSMVLQTHTRRSHRSALLNRIELEIASLRERGQGNCTDIVLWRNSDNKYVPRFSTADTWLQIRRTGLRVSWCKGVWFYYFFHSDTLSALRFDIQRYHLFSTTSCLPGYGSHALDGAQPTPTRQHAKHYRPAHPLS